MTQGSARAELLAPRRIGSYRLVRRLGRGATGEVWLGAHVQTGALAAIKTLREGRRASALHEEHRAIARLRHPHIAGVHELGPRHLATRYVEGCDLAHRMRTPIAIGDALRITLQLASALGHAHAHGVVHRDVKPSNVILDASGDAYLVDFGIATVGGRDEHAGRSVGTPAFWAPEQERGEHVGPAADQYALARTLLAMMTGARPTADSRTALVALADELPAGWVPVLGRALAERPEDRHPSVGDFARALEAVELGVRAPRARLAPELRSDVPFAWCTAASVERLGGDLERAEHRLSELVSRGALDRGRAQRFLEESGYGDLGFSMFARRAFLGAIDAPRALARASEVVVLVHGMFCTREAWRDVAGAIARENGRAVVLVPDVLGFGSSPFSGDGPTAEQASPRALVRTILAWLELLGVRDLPVVLVGHSIAGAALLGARDDELPADVSRLAVTPVYPFADPAYRAALRALAVVAARTEAHPGLKRVAGEAIFQGSMTARYGAEERRRLVESFVSSRGSVIARIARAYADVEPAAPEALERCAIAVGKDDPAAAERTIVRALRRMRVPESRVYRFASGGHFPHCEEPAHPGWASRNVHELTRLVDVVLESTRRPRTAVRVRGDSVVQTEPAPVSEASR